MPDKNHPRAIQMLHHHGFITRSDETKARVKRGGRADILAERNGQAFHIEVKRGVERFDFKEWRPNQRIWSEWTQKPPFSVPYYIFLTIGKHPPHYNPAKYLPKHSWLMPREAMIKAIEIITPHQEAIPLLARCAKLLVLKQNNLDAVHIFKEYELEWKSNNSIERPSWLKNDGEYGGFWIVPNGHPFYKIASLDYNPDNPFPDFPEDEE